MMFNVLLDGFVSSGVKCFIGVNFYMVYYCNAAYLLLLHILAFFYNALAFVLRIRPILGHALSSTVVSAFALCLPVCGSFPAYRVLGMAGLWSFMKNTYKL